MTMVFQDFRRVCLRNRTAPESPKNAIAMPATSDSKRVVPGISSTARLPEFAEVEDEMPAVLVGEFVSDGSSIDIAVFGT